MWSPLLHPPRTENVVTDPCGRRDSGANVESARPVVVSRADSGQQSEWHIPACVPDAGTAQDYDRGSVPLFFVRVMRRVAKWWVAPIEPRPLSVAERQRARACWYLRGL